MKYRIQMFFVAIGFLAVVILDITNIRDIRRTSQDLDRLISKLKEWQDTVSKK